MDRDERLSFWMKQYANRLAQVAYTYVQDRMTVEDILQNSFVRAYRSMHTLRNSEREFSWLARIVINECRRVHRTAPPETPADILPEDASEISVEDEYMAYLDSMNLHRVIMKLPVSFRMPVVLYYFEDLSTEEIGQVLGLNPITVRTRLNRARTKLQGILAGGERSHELGAGNSQG